MTQLKETNWEKEFDLLWGIAPEGSLKHQKAQYLKQFIRKAIAAREEEILEGLERWVKNARYLGEKEFLNKLNSLRNKHK